MIGVLVFPDFQLLDAAGPISVFEIAAHFANTAPSIKVVAVTPGPVRSSSGAEMLARGLKPSGAITTLIVAGGEGVRAAAKCKKTLAFVRAIAKRGVRVASVCSGAYVLAEAGLLDGRRATTHWQRTRHFLSAYPKVKLEADRIFVRDGHIWTSAGITAGIDLALAMATEDFGDEVAQKTARQLVLYHRRSGGQSQFSSLLELKAPAGRFAPLLAWARKSRCAADGGGYGRTGRHELAALHARLHCGDRHHAVESGGTAADRSGAAACAILQRGDRTRRRTDRLSRSRADAACLHPRLRPAAAIAAARGEGGVAVARSEHIDVMRGSTSRRLRGEVEIRDSEFRVRGLFAHSNLRICGDSPSSRPSSRERAGRGRRRRRTYFFTGA